jgi:hypothetical protein
MKEESIVALELSCLAFNIKIYIHDFILFNFEKIWKKNPHNNFFMLDPKVKNLHLMSSFIFHEQSKGYRKNDKKNLVSHFIKMSSSFASLV